MSVEAGAHQAFVYASEEEYVGGLLPFLRGGLEAEADVLAVTSSRNATSLRDALGDDAARVDWRDADDWYATPYRTQREYARYMEEKGNAGRVRVVGEPARAARTRAAAREWARSEAFLNMLFAATPAWLVCPYDARTLPEEVVAHAFRTHPQLWGPDGIRPSTEFLDPRAFSSALDEEPLEAPAAPVTTLDAGADLVDLRHRVDTWARQAGVEPARVSDVVLAAHELAVNAVAHGGGLRAVRSWTADGEAVLEVEDAGPGLQSPLSGRVEPGADRPSGFGLWLVHQLCDLVEIRSDPGRTLVRMHVALPAGESAFR